MNEETAVILCGAGDCSDLRALRVALESISGDAFCVEAHHSGEGLVSAFDAHLATGDLVPLVIVNRRLADGSGADALISLTDRDPNGPTRKVLALEDSESGEADRAIAAGVLDAVLARPWTYQELLVTAGQLVDGYRTEVDPEAANRSLATFAKGYSDSPVSAAIRATRDQAKPLSFLGDRDLSDGEVEQAMIEEMENVLDHPPSRRLPAGTLIVTEGESIDGITVLLDGEVRLFRRMEGREIVFHHLTAGRIIGLMSLTRSGPAVFSVEAETDVTILPVTLDELDSALRDSPSLAAHFVSVLVRSLARRNLRSIEQQLQIRQFATTRIKESERLAVVGQLAAGVAHELNNPLQGIVAYSHLLLERLAADDSHRSSVEKIVGQADRCIAIVRALLDFSRPVAPKKQSSDMNSLLRECVELVEAQALFLNIEINLDLDSTLPPAKVDPSQIQQVFVNLIINAAEAMDGDGHLAITTCQKDGQVEIEFSDSGPGIAEQDLELVFDPFFSTKEATHGTGLGLAISHGIVREHQGSITVASEPGAGASFVVRLPITADRPWSNHLEQE